MKTTSLVLLIGLLFLVGCASTPDRESVIPPQRVLFAAEQDDISVAVSEAEQKWKGFNQRQRPPLFPAAKVDRERRIYEKVIRSDVAEWRKRRAGWNYVFAVRDAMIPNTPTPPGRYTAQPNPFL